MSSGNSGRTTGILADRPCARRSILQDVHLILSDLGLAGPPLVHVVDWPVPAPKPVSSVSFWPRWSYGMSFVDHARAIAEAPVEAAPLSVIGARVVAAVRLERKGQARDEIERAALRAQGDAIFLFCLVLEVNRQAFEIAEREGLRAACAMLWMGALLGGPDGPPANAADAKERRDAWRHWHTLVDALALDVRVEEAARTRLEQRYLAGHRVLFADAAADWAPYVAQVERLTRLADSMTSIGHGKPPRRPAGEEDARIGAHADQLADDARVRAYEILGERERAVSIMEHRLRG